MNLTHLALNWTEQGLVPDAAIRAGIRDLHPLVTAYTLSLGTPESMAAAAARAADRPLLKVKLGGEGDPERIAAVREAAPECRLIVDANESWSPRSEEHTSELQSH